MHRLIASLVLFAAAAPVMAAEDVGPIPSLKQGLATGVTALLVFTVVLVVLRVKVWPTIGKALDERAAKIKEEIESAELARQQAKDALEGYQKSLADARAEAQKMLDATRAQQQALAAELKTKADAELAAMREKAMRDIDSAKRAALSEVYAQAAQLATMAAGKILRREVNPGDAQRMVDESLAQLSSHRN